MSDGVVQLLAAELIVAAIFALAAAALLVRMASRDLYQARAMRDEARALISDRGPAVILDG